MTETHQDDIFQKLMDVIESRKGGDPSVSYVARLMTKGREKISEKIMEEAREVCDAAGENDPAHLTYEICDLFFHALVMASYADISLDQIRSELERRFGTSGIAEKEGRHAT